jgi:hypothetical protein
MNAWIKQTVNPPGITKKNRGALFAALGKVFSVVKDDAIMAFNAHFPYLCDEQKLAEHGKALSVPRAAYDRDDEYRNRVTTASFYHTRAGERSYTREQLKEHFGDRYTLAESFLQISLKITDLSDEDNVWLRDFLDTTFDPIIAFAITEWFNFVATMTMSDIFRFALDRIDVDVQPNGFCYDGRFLCDQGKETLCNGQLKCDGSWPCEQFLPARGTVRDTILTSIFPNGAYKCDGSFDCSGYAPVYFPMDIQGPVFPVDTYADKFAAAMTLEALEDQAVITPICDGTFLCDGSNQKSMIDAPMKIRIIRPFRCDGTKRPTCSLCDGTWKCDGTYTGYDGWYYSGDLIEEEVL